MFRIFAVSAVMAVVATSALAADVTSQSTTDPYANPIEQCIRDNASKVEASFTDLSQGVDFLVVKVCAVPLAEQRAEQSRLSQQRITENWQRMCDDQSAKVDTKGDTTRPAGLDYCQLARNSALTRSQPAFNAWSTNAITFGNYSPPAAVALASQLLLSLRLAHRHHDN